MSASFVILAVVLILKQVADQSHEKKRRRLHRVTRATKGVRFIKKGGRWHCRPCTRLGRPPSLAEVNTGTATELYSELLRI